MSHDDQDIFRESAISGDPCAFDLWDYLNLTPDSML